MQSEINQENPAVGNQKRAIHEVPYCGKQLTAVVHTLVALRIVFSQAKTFAETLGGTRLVSLLATLARDTRNSLRVAPKYEQEASFPLKK